VRTHMHAFMCEITCNSFDVLFCVNWLYKYVMMGRESILNGGNVTESVTCHKHMFPFMLMYFFHSISMLGFIKWIYSTFIIFVVVKGGSLISSLGGKNDLLGSSSLKDLLGKNDLCSCKMEYVV
jgi:hypothetical protein